VKKIQTRENLFDTYVKVAKESVEICFAVESDGTCECGCTCKNGKMFAVRVIDIMRNGQELWPGTEAWKKAMHKLGEIIPPRFPSCIADMFLRYKEVFPSK